MARHPHPYVSVVMSVCNGERYLEEAIESVLTQTFSNFEFLVVDDGSTDRTSTILDQYAGRDSRLVVLHQENHGPAAARNRGCTRARGSYIANLDADDLATPARLELQADFLDDHPDVGVVGGAVTVIDADGNALWDEAYPLDHYAIVAAFESFCPFVHSTVMMRRSLLNAVGGYHSLFPPGEDFDLWLRLSEHTRLANLPELLALYRFHDTQLTSRRLEQQALSVLIAKAAWRARRRTGVDPTEGASAVSAELLQALGVTADDIARQRVRSGLWYAKTMYAAGYAGVATRTLWTTLKAARGDRQLTRQVLQLWFRQLRRSLSAYVPWRRGRRSPSKQTT